MSNNGNNEKTTEEIEIIKVRKKGMSYGELKKLHKISKFTLKKISKVISSLPSTSTSTSASTPTPTSTTPNILYSSKNVKISKTNNNWLIPYLPFKESCRVCRYFGHSLKNCPNLLPEFRGLDSCLH